MFVYTKWFWFKIFHLKSNQYFPARKPTKGNMLNWTKTKDFFKTKRDRNDSKTIVPGVYYPLDGIQWELLSLKPTSRRLQLSNDQDDQRAPTRWHSMTLISMIPIGYNISLIYFGSPNSLLTNPNFICTLQMPLEAKTFSKNYSSTHSVLF